MQGYRNAGRRKTQRKMVRLVRAASALEIRVQPSEREALLLENELIRTLRPRFNVDGAYCFLYPAIGTGADAHRALLCFTTRVDAFAPLGVALARLLPLAAAHARGVRGSDRAPRLRGPPRAGAAPRGRRAPARVAARGLSAASIRSSPRSTRSCAASRRGCSPSSRRSCSRSRPHGARRRRWRSGLRRLEAFFASDARKLRDALQGGGPRPTRSCVRRSATRSSSRTARAAGVTSPASDARPASPNAGKCSARKLHTALSSGCLLERTP